MMYRLTLFLILASIQLFGQGSTAESFVWPTGQAPQARHQLLIVVDGMRPDYIQEAWMPNLHRLSESGVRFENHHAVYPTVTRVNAASISTGTYPERHGLVDNTVYFPRISEQFTLSTEDHVNLQRIARTEGELLEAKSIGKHMEEAGKRLLVCSSGSTGSAYLLDPEVAGIGIVNVGMQLPATLAAEVVEALGEVPEERTPNSDRNRWIVDAYLHFGLRDFQADAAIIWITDPDHTAHTQGMGSEKTLAALKAVDEEIGRILAAIEEADAQDQVNILIASDHGFTTMNGTEMPLKVLYQYMGEQGRPMSDVVLAGFGVYFKRDADVLAPGLVSALQATDWVGSIYAPPGSSDEFAGKYPGTISMTGIHYYHPRAPHLLISPQWSHATNEHGIAGTVELPGIAGHGGDSPYDIHNTLIAFGPDFARETRITTPTSNVDLAPTLCALQSLEIPESMQGRVLGEAFRNPIPAGDVTVKSEVYQAEFAGGSYSLEGHWTMLNGNSYYDQGKASRTMAESQ